MNHERFHGEGESESRTLFPVPRGTVEQAFPLNIKRKDTVSYLMQEAKHMKIHNKDLYDKLAFGSLQDTYGSSKVNLMHFRYGGLFLYRILRHSTNDLPILSTSDLELADREHKKDMKRRGESIPMYFANEWEEKFAIKLTNKALAEGLDRARLSIGGQMNEVWGGAYYVARAYQRHEEAKNLQKQFPNAWS